MNFFLLLLIGFFVGIIATRFAERHSYGVAGDALVGILGAFVGGALPNAQLSELYGVPWGSAFSATLGAVIFVVIARLLHRAMHSSHTRHF